MICEREGDEQSFQTKRLSLKKKRERSEDKIKNKMEHDLD